MAGHGKRDQIFLERLGRINASGPDGTQQVFVGPADTNQKRKAPRVSIAARMTGKVSESEASTISLLGSGILVGILAVMLARYGRFHLNGGALSGPDSDIMMVVDVVLAITVAILLRMIFRVRSKVHGVGKIFGIAATILLMHNVVHIAPGLFEKAYSVEWVDQVLTDTLPVSVLVAGVSYTKTQAYAPAPPVVVVLRMAATGLTY